MATAKQQPKKILYHRFFCGEGNLGESDGFFEITDGKLSYVSGWDCNDAHWREEYMSGLLSWAGVEIKDLPEKYLDEAVRLAEKEWGLDYGHDDDEAEEVYTSHTADLFCQEGGSDKVYVLRLTKDDEGYRVAGDYGRRGGKIKTDVKCEGATYEAAKAIYDKVLAEKLKKGYKPNDDLSDFEDGEEDYE